jgi:hypothetical protein
LTVGGGRAIACDAQVLLQATGAKCCGRRGNVQQSAGPGSAKVQRANMENGGSKARDSGAVKDAIHCAWKAGTLGK